jgi:Xaa-Pro aminopeptidase
MEREAASLLRYLMVSECGAQDESFETIVAFDGNTSMPHYQPGDVRLKKNSAVLVDFGAKYGYYHSDMTRTFFMGLPNEKLLKIHHIVLEAQQKAIKILRSGTPVKAVDEAARKHIENEGYGERFGHATGHGIGLEIHEGPVVGPKTEASLASGNMVTVEPGIYIPGLGGVRIEDDVLVTESGRRNLCSLSRDPFAPW